ncbi:leucine-rich_repeat domain-containing protein [Hexamita inflata]|uniref:Leucine-rich repeat domain-containing protein n=1 Tax=Hexamita inflata TaxID=28002 RepID=A0AA86PGF9_9EUKA|nr:leucine-rich repeat domain-containing protein [Hexamita inflata]
MIKNQYLIIYILNHFTICFRLNKVLYYDKIGKITIYDYNYKKLIRRQYNLLERNEKQQIKHLLFVDVDQTIVIQEYINQLLLKILGFQHSKQSGLQVDLEVLNQTEGNKTVITLAIKNYILKDEKSLLKLCALQNLILDSTDFKDFGILKNLNLSYLQIKDNKMSFQDKRTICQLTSLYQLHLDNCSFREVHLLQELTQLRELTLKNNSLANSDFMACEFRLLQKLDVSYNLLKSLDYLTALSPCLVELNASHNKIGKLFYSDEHDVINVEILNLSYNKLFDINQLTRFTNLKELNLQSNKLGEKRVKVLKQLQIQSLNLTSIQCRTLNCLNTKYVTIVKMHSQIKNYNTLNLFSSQKLLKFNIGSDILPNNLIHKLKIIKQSTQINPQFRERQGYQNQLKRYKIQLFKHLNVQRFSNILYKVNFLNAIERKHSGFQQIQQQKEIQFRLTNILNIYKLKFQRNNLKVVKLYKFIDQLNLLGFE